MTGSSNPPAGEECMQQVANTIVMGGLAGAAYGAAAAAWIAKPAVGQHTWPLVLNTSKLIGSNAGILAGAAGVYQAGKCTTASLRGGKDDVWNNIVGGCAAGSLAGLKTGRVVNSVTGCGLVGAFAAFVHICNTTLTPERQTSLEILRVNRELAEKQRQQTENSH